MAVCLTLLADTASTQAAFSQCWLWLAVVPRPMPYGRCCKVCFPGMFPLFRLIVRSHTRACQPPVTWIGQYINWYQAGMFTFCAQHESVWCFWGFQVVVHAPPGGPWDTVQQAAQEKQPVREPPSSFDQSKLHHGSVILNNYILIWLCFRNMSPLF